MKFAPVFVSVSHVRVLVFQLNSDHNALLQNEIIWIIAIKFSYLWPIFVALIVSNQPGSTDTERWWHTLTNEKRSSRSSWTETRSNETNFISFSINTTGGFFGTCWTSLTCFWNGRWFIAQQKDTAIMMLFLCTCTTSPSQYITDTPWRYWINRWGWFDLILKAKMVRWILSGDF